MRNSGRVCQLPRARNVSSFSHARHPCVRVTVIVPRPCLQTQPAPCGHRVRVASPAAPPWKMWLNIDGGGQQPHRSHAVGLFVRLHPKHTTPFSHHHRQGTPAAMPGTHAIHSTETTRRPLGIAKAAGGQEANPGGSVGVNQSWRRNTGAKRDTQKERKRLCLTSGAGAVSGTRCCAGV